MAREDFQDRSERASPKRRQEARKKGRVAKSREIPSTMVLIAGILILYLWGFHIYQSLTAMARDIFTHLDGLGKAELDDQALCFRLLGKFLVIMTPLMGGIVMVAVAGNILQTGFLLSPQALTPSFSKINPIKGMTRLFSMQSLMELLKCLVKLAIVGYVAFVTVKGETANLIPLADNGPGEILRYICAISFKIFVRVCLIIAALSAIDYAFQRWEFEKGLKMTKHEVKEELRQTEGDPLIKSRIRSLQRQMARRRMMKAVPEADVVITNPIHLAIALQYIKGEIEAPKVVAKGAGVVAERIKELALAHAVPIVEDKSLAQALYRRVDIGEMIPTVFYQAVAQVLAYVYKLKGKHVS